MNPDQPSRTAENNAVLRAREFMRPKHRRICHDPFAAWFLPDRILSAPDIDQEIRRTVASWEDSLPGVGNAILARTRFMDDCLTRALDGGIRQLVILGAGFDTRALRFDCHRRKVAVFELDHPVTQRAKLERIQKKAKAHLPHVQYISVDFSSQSLEQKLLVHGYDKGAATFFILEGVTYYLPPRAIDRTLGFMAENSAPGSRLVFDYFPPSVADGTTLLPEARALQKGLKEIGEEIVFGVEPDQLHDFLAQRGFALMRNLTAPESHAAYFTKENQSRRVSGMFAFALAKTT